MFEIIFYVFSLLLSYLDYKKYIVPNNILLTLLLMLVTFGFLEDRLNIYSFAISISLLMFFCVIILINRNMVLGGGDIKYIMVVAIFLEPILFPFFLITTGITQSMFLIYAQYVKKKKIAPMVPAMFLAVIITLQLKYFSFLHLENILGN